MHNINNVTRHYVSSPKDVFGGDDGAIGIISDSGDNHTGSCS